MAIKRRMELRPDAKPGVAYKPLTKDKAYWTKEKKNARAIMDRLGPSAFREIAYREAQERWSTADEALQIERKTGSLPNWATK